jgi:hypothetical protein
MTRIVKGNQRHVEFPVFQLGGPSGRNATRSESARAALEGPGRFRGKMQAETLVRANAQETRTHVAGRLCATPRGPHSSVQFPTANLERRIRPPSPYPLYSYAARAAAQFP